MSVFTQKASLMHLNNSSNTWEDKGSGQINVSKKNENYIIFAEILSTIFNINLTNNF